jgi:hypothetical protein
LLGAGAFFPSLKRPAPFAPSIELDLNDADNGQSNP